MEILGVKDACEFLQNVTGTKIVLYASTTPRIGTYLPLLEEMRNNGYDPIFCVGKKARMPESIIKFLGIGLERIYMMDSDEIGLLAPVDILFCAEIDVIAPPESSVNVAIHHSLPDHEGFRISLHGALKFSPTMIKRFDYYVFPTEKSKDNVNKDLLENWSIGIYPKSLLHTRTSRIRFVPGGYPKLDLLERIMGGSEKMDCIIYAPTKSGLQYACSKEYGLSVLNTLKSNFPEHRIVYRPYPGDRIAEIDEAMDLASGFVVDNSSLGDEYLKRACTVVTDFSSFATEFSLASRRPYVSCAFKKEGPSTVLKDDLCFRVHNIENMVEAVRMAINPCAEWTSEISDFCQGSICNPRSSSQYIVQKIPIFMERATHPDFIETKRTHFLEDANRTDAIEHISHLKSIWERGNKSQSIALKEISEGLGLATSNNSSLM